jgi:hypothetical protein
LLQCVRELEFQALTNHADPWGTKDRGVAYSQRSGSLSCDPKNYLLNGAAVRVYDSEP